VSCCVALVCDSKHSGSHLATRQQLHTDYRTTPFNAMDHPPVVSTLDELRTELHRVFDEDHVNVDYVKELMESYQSKPADWKKYALWDRYKYTRNMVDEGNGKFNLMLLCWGPSQTSTIHDHADAHCFMK
ncbi:unnamed protein product, partial [Meganyctiphanes norvegica]